MAGSPGAIQGPLSHASKTPGRLARKMRMKKWAREVGSPTHPCPGLVFSLFCPQPNQGGTQQYGAPWSLNLSSRDDMEQMKGCPSLNTRGQFLRQAQQKIQTEA